MAGRRMIHRNICTSEKIAQLTWFEEVLYYRILVSADDYGMYFSTPGSVLENCFPKLKDTPKGISPTIKTVSKGLRSLEKATLIRREVADNRPVIVLNDWDKYQYLRPDREKHSYFGVQARILPDMTQDTDKDKVKVKNQVKVDKPVAPQQPEVRLFKEAWGETWKSTVGNGKVYMCNHAKEGKLIKDLLKIYTYEDLIKLAEAFFKSSDDFIKKSGYTIGVFRSMIPKLIAGNKSLSKVDKIVDAAKNHLRSIKNNDATRKLS